VPTISAAEQAFHTSPHFHTKIYVDWFVELFFWSYQIFFVPLQAETNNSITTTMKQQFIQLLRSTNRQGVENVINWLEQSDFFEAPASTVFHGNYAGGLLEHSMNVAILAHDVHQMLCKHKSELAEQVTRDNIIIAALLHDICKANIYQKTTKYRKDANNAWETYETYSVDYSEFPMGHGEKSVIRLLQLGLQLTTDEMVAIRWHMTAWELPFQSGEAKANLNAAKNQCPLLSIIQTADGLASAILEK
jgi:hypothetical protein